MERKEIYRTIQNYFRDKPVKKVFVFGSYATGEQKSDSDIDLLIDFKKPVGLLQLARFKSDLEDQLNLKVDLGTLKGVSKHAKPYVNKSLTTIYES
ncbi:MAG: nucleotidyltransferase domain-containing protein [Balneolaceae bacterium]